MGPFYRTSVDVRCRQACTLLSRPACCRARVGAPSWLRHWIILERSLTGLHGETLTLSIPASRQQQSRGFRPGGGSLRYGGQPINWPINLHEFPGPQGGLITTSLSDSPWAHSSPTGTSAAILSIALPRISSLTTLSFPMRRPDQWNACPSGCTPATGIWSARGLKPVPKVETVASRGRNRRTKGVGSGRKVLPKVPAKITHHGRRALSRVPNVSMRGFCASRGEAFFTSTKSWLPCLGLRLDAWCSGEQGSGPTAGRASVPRGATMG